MNLAPLYHWYASAKRELPWRETTNPYYIWLSEIILQQTRVQQGMAYYFRFIERFPTVADLADAEEDEVLRLWQGLGYYSRARNLHAAAKMVVGEPRKTPPRLKTRKGEDVFPSTFEELRALPGVGEYTAGAIMSFAYDAPYPAADGNVYRVLSRLFDCDEPFDTTAGKKMFRQFAWELLNNAIAESPNNLIGPRLHNSAIMEFGALYCVPQNPDCDHCPLMAVCKAYAAGTVNLLPVRKPRLKPKDRYFLYHVYLTPDGQTLLHKRTEKDIWQHLYEFPMEEALSQPPQGKDPSRVVSSKNSLDSSPSKGDEYVHVLSHQRIHAWFEVHKVEKLPTIADSFPVSISQLDDYALSVLTLRFLDSKNLG